MKNQLIIIALTVICLSTSMLFLSYTEHMQHAHDENFWSIAFVDPFSLERNDFIIDNRGPAMDFIYVITSNDTRLFEESITLDADAQIRIATPNVEPDQPFTITVTDQDAHQKSIYK